MTVYEVGDTTPAMYCGTRNGVAVFASADHAVQLQAQASPDGENWFGYERSDGDALILEFDEPIAFDFQERTPRHLRFVVLDITGSSTVDLTLIVANGYE